MGTIKLTPYQIESWVARHFDYRSRKGGEELTICNPFIPGDTKFKFNISTVAKGTKKHPEIKGYWVHDWRPSAAGSSMSFLRFVQKYKGISFKEAVKDVCGDGIDFRAILRSAKPQPEREEEEEIEVILELPKGSIPISEGPPKLKKLAVNYLKRRGVSYDMAVAHRLHYTGTDIVFPYLEYDAIVYWQSRSILDKTFEFPDERKVKIGKSQFLYGFDEAEPYQDIFLTEAIFCSLTIGPGGLATGGATLSENQRRKIRAINPSRIILAPDNDQEGKCSLYENYRLLSPYGEVWYVLPPNPFKDWNDIAQKYGTKGNKVARVYAEKHVKRLTLKDAIRFRRDNKPRKLDRD